jgi:hypothetical protein
LSAVPFWMHCKEWIRDRRKIMWNFKAYISLLCLCVVTANPVMAASLPCCCTKPIEAKATCCHASTQKSSHVKNGGRACCSQKLPTPSVTKEPCRCCVKSIPQPVPTKDTQLTVTNVEYESAIHCSHLIVPSATPHRRQLEIEGPFPPVGSTLLALYCKWLE